MDLTTFEWEAAVRTVYGEARGEDYQGKFAVACVIRNRIDRGMASGVLDCVFRKAQFSCWNADDPNKGVIGNLNLGDDNPLTMNNVTLRECKTAVNASFSDASVDITNGATHYMTKALYERLTSSPQDHWCKKMIKTRIIGNHIFMRQP